jgi:hypothetical protein
MEGQRDILTIRSIYFANIFYFYFLTFYENDADLIAVMFDKSSTVPVVELLLLCTTSHPPWRNDNE